MIDSEKILEIKDLCGLNISQFSKATGIERTVLGRIINKERVCNEKHARKISNFLSCSLDQLYKSTSAELKQFVDNKNINSQLSNPSFLFLDQKTESEQLEKIMGQYELYHYSDNTNNYIVSFVEIKKIRGEYTVIILNPYLDDYDKRTRFYKYEGKAFYSAGFFHLYLKEIERSFSIAKISLADPNSPRMTILRGIWHGIGVLKSQNFVSSVEIILLKSTKRHEPDKITGSDFGYKTTDECPKVVNEMHKKQKIIIN